MTELIVSLSPQEACDIAVEGVFRCGASVELVDSYQSASPDGRATALAVLDKYFMRNSSRASVTILAENLTGQTRVVAIGAGGSEGALFNIDWGASGNMERAAEKALRQYAV